jgi:hypothetical protein
LLEDNLLGQFVSAARLSSFATSQTANELPNPSRAERVNHAEPPAAMND